jgi:hypothetical protein
MNRETRRALGSGKYVIEDGHLVPKWAARTPPQTVPKEAPSGAVALPFAAAPEVAKDAAPQVQRPALPSIEHRHGDLKVVAAQKFVELARRKLDDAVRLDRANGASWSSIAAALSVSKQTAHERFRHVEAASELDVVLTQ